MTQILIVTALFTVAYVIRTWPRRQPRPITETDVEIFEIEIAYCDDVVGALEQETS